MKKIFYKKYLVLFIFFFGKFKNFKERNLINKNSKWGEVLLKKLNKKKK